ncbi:MBL fold metallo-hydrolase [Anaerophaga thermohalophila]|uniref:MBL fold metallo-hydrolase n=1 Tax=Anaerophaga thermohalophila TaxID=177400 RepID=UPI000237C23E|nr:MBL fold metallo-hydrolase [Anaerophaga thermohalophila]
MKVTFLGTGTSMGIPMIACDCEVCHSSDTKDKRMRSSVKIETDDRVVVIDSGPDFRQQMLASDTKRLDAILYTHEHKDHTAGLDDVRAFNWINKQPTQLYAEERTLSALKKEYAYAFKDEDEKYPGVPDLILNEINDHASFKVFGIPVVPVRVYHHLMPVLGFRIGNFSYITDASRIPDESMSKLKNSEVFVINGLRIKEHISHFNLEQAIAIIKELEPRQAFITHISHHMGLHAEISKQLPGNIALAYDGLEIEV